MNIIFLTNKKRKDLLISVVELQVIKDLPLHIEFLETIADIIVVDNEEIFKLLTGRKYDFHLMLQTISVKSSKMKCILIPPSNYFNKELVKHSIKYVNQFIENTKIEYLKNTNIIIKNEFGKDEYNSLINIPVLTCDIETTGLSFYNDSIVSIAFGIDKYTSIAIDLRNDDLLTLEIFFKTYKGKLIFHNASFDLKFLMYKLFKDIYSIRKTLYYLNYEDTMLLTYVNINSTNDYSLSLKANTMEYTGHYALEVEDISKYSTYEILRYNGIDTLATYYLYEKYNTIDNKAYIVLKNSINYLVQMMLTGMPVNLVTVEQGKESISNLTKKARTTINNLSFLPEFIKKCNEEEMVKTNSKLKKLVKPIECFNLSYNPSSSKQTQKLLYDFLKLPIIDITDKKQPSTGSKTLHKLLNYVEGEPKILIEQLLILSESSTVLSSFIGKFKEISLPSIIFNCDCINGDFILGGTISGRLSSRNPNLQNIPSGSIHGKVIKECFEAPKGYLIAYADYSALEDRIVAILSKDPAKTAIFTKGLDSHSLNAYGYYHSQMPDIQTNISDIDNIDVEAINSIATKYKALRNRSKSSTFALNYKGTYMTLHKKNGIPLKEAIEIEEGHRKIYKRLHQFSEENKQFAINNGYVECAFGLKVQTPILYSKVNNNLSEQEARSSNNAVTQSWGLLVNRALVELNQRIIENNIKDIFFINQIHDCVMLLVKEDVPTIKWLNDNLIDCMLWQEDIIKSDLIHLEVAMDIGKKWSKLISLENNASLEVIQKTLEEI